MKAVLSMLLLLTALVASACGEDSPSDAGATATTAPTTDPSTVSEEPSPTTNESDTCSQLLADDVVEPLGWTSLSEPGESAGRCERTSDMDTITVGQRLDLEAGGDVQSATAAYDKLCVELRRDNALSPDTDTDWLGEDVTACFRPFPKSQDLGLAELVMLTDDAVIVEIQIATSTPTGEQNVKDMLARLVPLVESNW